MTLTEAFLIALLIGVFVERAFREWTICRGESNRQAEVESNRKFLAEEVLRVAHTFNEERRQEMHEIVSCYKDIANKASGAFDDLWAHILDVGFKEIMQNRVLRRTQDVTEAQASKGIPQSVVLKGSPEDILDPLEEDEAVESTFEDGGTFGREAPQ